MTEQIGVFARRTPSGEFLPAQPIMREVPEEREQAAVDYIDEQLAKLFIDEHRQSHPHHHRAVACAGCDIYDDF